MTDDPFRTEELRRRVLAAWRESSARFRADANVEDDLALVGYRDRVVIELAQNAADAAHRAAVRGRVVFTLAGGVLRVANNGAGLDAGGVESIAVARASAKLEQDGTAGRFGVGFAAVLAVSDAPSIGSAAGSVRWSRADALVAVEEIPELREELARRAGRVPVLRLPFADEPFAGATDQGAVTEVVLPLLDDLAVASVREQLEGLDPTILLALPALDEVVVRLDDEERVLRAERRVGDSSEPAERLVLHDGPQATRWALATASGLVEPHLLVDQPQEQRSRTTWTVTWAIPLADNGNGLVGLPASVAPVVRAPTGVDDLLTVPAVLVASYPLDATRRRITSGPLADEVTRQAAAVLVDLLSVLPSDPSMLRLVPSGFPDGAIDGAIRAAILDRMQEQAWLPREFEPAGEPDLRQRPREAVAVADALVGPLSAVTPSLLPRGWSGPQLAVLGVRRPTVAELVESLTGVDRPPAWWRDLYEGLDQAVPPGPERDALGALPVPLADGGLVTGPRGLALPAPDGLPAVDLTPIGIRVVNPAAVHPLLAALGAGEGTALSLLEQPHVEAAVVDSFDAEDPEPVAVAVLSLMAAVGRSVPELNWLAELALPDAEGDWRPAGELLLPTGRLAGLVAEDSAFGFVADDWARRWGDEVLARVGVLDGPAVLREADAVGPDHDLEDEAAWWATLPAESSVTELVAVRDLEQISAARLPDLLGVLVEPPWRAAVVEPALVVLADGSRRQVRPYTAWWLSTRPVLDGHAPRDLRLRAASPEPRDDLLVGLYDLAPTGLDEEFLRALGVVRELADASAQDVLDRLADGRRAVTRPQLRALNAWLSGEDATAPARVRAVAGDGLAVVDAADAVIVDAPDLLPLLGELAIVPVALGLAGSLADVLDLPLASELAAFEVVSTGTVVADAVHHDRLVVQDLDGVEREVIWRLVDEVLHVDRRDLAVGLGRGRAWRDGVWSERHRLTEALSDRTLGRMSRAEDDLDDDPRTDPEE